jgi:hypothetical protein
MPEAIRYDRRHDCPLLERNAMSRNTDARHTRALRMDMLRMRAELERAEVRAAVGDLRDRGARLRTIGLSAGSFAAAVNARRGWVGLAAGILRRPWAAALALGALRSIKRRPALGIAAMLAAAAGLAVARRRGRDPDDPFGAPMA